MPLQIPHKPQYDENREKANDGADGSSDDLPSLPSVDAMEILKDEIHFFFHTLWWMIFMAHRVKIHDAICEVIRSYA